MFEQFLTRQAILRDNLSLFGYELRLRAEGRDNAGPHLGLFLSDSTTMVFHWESLVGKQLAFLPLTPRELSNGGALILPRDRAVIQIAVNEVSAELLETCESLKASGFRLAVDDWISNPALRTLQPFADFVRVKITAAAASRGAELASGHTVPIALHVDTWGDHRSARDFGFRMFQGNFFLQPQIFRRRTVAGTHRNALRLLRALMNSPLDLPQIEQIVREEPALTYKLLRYLNSPAMERAVEVRSIRNAIALLGEQEFRRWASIVAMATPATDKPSELMRIALTRAYFCEQLALQVEPKASYDFFFAGLLSVMDAVLDRPMQEIVTELAIPDHVRKALCGEPGTLRNALQAAQSYEGAAWPEFRSAMEGLSLPELSAPKCFHAAAGKASELLRQEHAG